MGDIFLVRFDRLDPEAIERFTEGKPFTFTESTTRRWRLKPGGLLVFSVGSGDDLRFLGTATAAEVHSEETVSPEGRSTFVVRISADQVERFREVRDLEIYMYSLQQVANLAKPYLHFRHRVRVASEDVETLRLGRLNETRSTYYGVLRHLPPSWRNYLQAAAHLRVLAKRGLMPFSEVEDATIRELLHETVDLLAETVVTPAELAADIAAMRTRSGVAAEPAVAIDDDDTTWDMESFLNAAASIHEARDEWGQVISLASQSSESEFDRQVKWRPPHW